MDTAQRYRDFAEHEARGESPAYADLAHRMAGDAALLRLPDDLPPVKRQPNLVLAAVQYLGGPPDTAWIRRRWTEVAATVATRSTQTNEAGRCAVLLPWLVPLPQPLALLEVGASAGLCLYPDAYAYRYNGGPLVGDGEVVLDCTASVGGDVVRVSNGDPAVA